MLCVIPFFSGDKDQAIRLANWIKTLGGVKHHSCLLVVDPKTNADGVFSPIQDAFQYVYTINSDPVDSAGWGNGTVDATAPNEMHGAACRYVYHKFKCPWFWLEPDAVPMRPTWLDEIEQEYLAAKKPFMGMYVNMPPHEPHMSGIGVYPANVADHSLSMMIPGSIAWDYAARLDTVGKKKAHFTKLIQHEYRVQWYGEEKPVGPTFPSVESLKHIKPEAAVFHRCKDGTLIARLMEQRGIPTEPVREETIEEVRAQLFEARAEIERLKKGRKRETKSSAETVDPKRQAVLDRMAKARAARRKKVVA